jgi:uncharacterized protein (TIGR02246 family)
MAAEIKVFDPRDIDARISKAFEDGDLDGACSLYEPGCAFVTFSGAVTTSASEIRAELEGLVAMRPTVTVEEVAVIECNDGTLATTRARGTISGTGPDGEPAVVPFHTLAVVRKQPDGSWKFLIDDPNGSAKNAPATDA